MLADNNGLVDTVKYWAEGSREKALELVLAQIKHFELKDDVGANLGLIVSTAESQTNAYIVETAASALQALKECRSETHRLEYRLALTVLAPHLSDEMGRRVAAALRIPRNKPYQDAIKSAWRSLSRFCYRLHLLL